MHFTIDPFKPAVTLETDKVGINGQDPAVEFFCNAEANLLINENLMVTDNNIMSETRNDSLESGLG